MLNTEAPNSRHANLDLYPTEELVNAFIDDQAQAASAVRAVNKQLVLAVEAAVPRIAGGGRLVYVGAGTSGRLGLLDSVELYPTFSWPRERAVAVLAGGARAMYEAIEGAEDDRQQGAADIRAIDVNASDVIILLAASGVTPYVLGAMKAARAAGALTIGLCNNPQAPVALEAEIGITLDTGQEVISGSTRLKAGTSQKIALNTLSSAIMVRLHKVHGNLMVDLKPTNAKLIRRAVNLIRLVTGADGLTAQTMLEASAYQVKVAIVAISKQLSVDAAQQRLAAVDGNVRQALAN